MAYKSQWYQHLTKLNNINTLQNIYKINTLQNTHSGVYSIYHNTHTNTHTNTSYKRHLMCRNPQNSRQNVTTKMPSRTRASFYYALSNHEMPTIHISQHSTAFSLPRRIVTSVSLIGPRHIPLTTLTTTINHISDAQCTYMLEESGCRNGTTKQQHKHAHKTNVYFKNESMYVIMEQNTDTRGWCIIWN